MAGNAARSTPRATITKRLLKALDVVHAHLCRDDGRATARARQSCSNARVSGARRQARRAQDRCQERHLLLPVQGGHVRRRRQLGPRPLRASATPASRWTSRRIDVSFSSAAGVLSVSAKTGAGVDFSEEDGQRGPLRRRNRHRSSPCATAARRRRAWGCDLTYDYVKINGDYRT